MNRPTSTFYSCTYTTKDKKSFLALARILRSEALKNYTANHNHSNPVASAGIYQLSHIPNPPGQSGECKNKSDAFFYSFHLPSSVNIHFPL
jgi:hypothetical protein